MPKQNKTEFIGRIRVTKKDKKLWEFFLKMNKKNESQYLREVVNSCIQTLPEGIKDNIDDNDFFKTMEMVFKKK